MRIYAPYGSYVSSGSSIYGRGLRIRLDHSMTLWQDDDMTGSNIYDATISTFFLLYPVNERQSSAIDDYITTYNNTVEA